MEQSTVLIVEDDETLQRIYRRTIGTRLKIVFASTVEEGKRMFLEHRRDLVAVILDGIVPLSHGDIRPYGSPPTTLDLARSIRSMFTGPILAVSSGDNKALLGAGCTHSCDKTKLPEEVRRVLGLDT